MNTVSNIEKIVEFVEAANAGSGEELAAKIKRGGRRSGLKVVSSDEGQVIITTDDETMLRIVHEGDPGFTAFSQFMGRKRSVLLPKLEKVGETAGWTIFRIEELRPLDEVVGEKVAAEFSTWVNRYTSTRGSGDKALRSKDFKAPDLGQLVNYGNLRGLLNKLINHANESKGVRFNSGEMAFMVRGDDQLVIADPMVSVH